MTVVAAADILGFSGTEGQLVQRMLQNLHPRVKSYLLFVNRPESIQDLLFYILYPFVTYLLTLTCRIP
jgi:hypothetical protein